MNGDAPPPPTASREEWQQQQRQRRAEESALALEQIQGALNRRGVFNAQGDYLTAAAQIYGAMLIAESQP